MRTKIEFLTREELLQELARVRLDNQQIVNNCFTIAEVQKAQREAIDILLKRKKGGV